ncbi:hypothetical protein FI667_g7267, partial [Globisporangium splendens]
MFSGVKKRPSQNSGGGELDLSTLDDFIQRRASNESRPSNELYTDDEEMLSDVFRDSEQNKRLESSLLKSSYQE